MSERAVPASRLIDLTCVRPKQVWSGNWNDRNSLPLISSGENWRSTGSVRATEAVGKSFLARRRDRPAKPILPSQLPAVAFDHARVVGSITSSISSTGSRPKPAMAPGPTCRASDADGPHRPQRTRLSVLRPVRRTTPIPSRQQAMAQRVLNKLDGSHRWNSMKASLTALVLGFSPRGT